MVNKIESANYRTGALLGACDYLFPPQRHIYVLISKMRLIKSAFFNASIVRAAAKHALKKRVCT